MFFYETFAHPLDGVLLLFHQGPLTFVPAVPFVSYLLGKDGGLRSTMRLAAVLSFSGCLIRMIPTFLSTEEKTHWVSTLPLHIGQILNGIAGPVLIAAPSRLSAIWFPPIQRARVTAIANSSLFGAAIGFYLGQKMHITELLWITLAMSGVPLILVFAYCPSAPRVPPSRAVVLNKDQTPLQFLKSAGKILCEEPSMLLFMITTGLGVGVYDAWIGVRSYRVSSSDVAFVFLLLFML
jgi:FLVCR family MFS transporter